MQAVVLAAGLGRRLSEGNLSLAKPLVPLAGIPLIAHTLRALAETSVDRVVVVTGHQGEAVRDAVRECARLPAAFVSNPEYARCASYSLAAARSECGTEPFLLLMCDHAMSPGLLEVLLRSAGSEPLGEMCRVAADRAGHHDEAYIAEATKLSTDAAGLVTAIGKRLPTWDALDAGAFLCSASVWDALEGAPEDCHLGEIFGLLARRRRLATVDISGHFWYDIDTIDDLQAAERLLAAGVPGPLRAPR